MAGAAVLAEVTARPPTAESEALRNFVRAQLTLEVDPDVINPFSKNVNRDQILRDRIRAAVMQRDFFPTPLLLETLFDEIVGLGPLEPLMADPDITDILVNRFDEIYVERRGHLEFIPHGFRDQAQLEQVIQKLVALVGREINLDKPLVDARMVDGSRANAVYAPVGGPTLCIRKFNRLRLDLLPDKRHPELPSWVSTGGISAEMGGYLEAMAIARANILIAGATGSGKSTLLRSVVSAFPDDERVITIEDTAELELDNPHWVKLECVHSGELAGKTTQERRLDVADLVQNALRMRPDRLIIGEIRHSKEAYYALEALNTGHDGSATTIHAGSCEDALARLELLISRDFAQLSPAEIRRYVARVFDLVVFVSRLRNGRRYVLEIAELLGVGPDDRYQLATVFSAEVSNDAQGISVDFSGAPAYRPGSRLLRKLQLQGMRWMS
ncbi:MAG: CpaF family protein [Chloroflexi bacterium]|nr:MAG: CpaF family protein [Chloroflexota bacterium]